MKKWNVGIIGGGSIGLAIADGLVSAGKYKPDAITITRRNEALLKNIRKMGFRTSSENISVVKNVKLIFVAVRPSEVVEVLKQIRKFIKPTYHVMVSVVTGVTTGDISEITGKKFPIIRAMPNTAIAIGESMTCLCCNREGSRYIEYISDIFQCMGKTKIVSEDDMIAATSLCACGVAFFLRGIRAAAQGGIEIGFHSEDAIYMAAQTALGAAKLLLHYHKHPEQEIDKVTTPKGCTIAGLNEMEHEGFSSAIIKGIKTSAEKADKLFKK